MERIWHAMLCFASVPLRCSSILHRGYVLEHRLELGAGGRREASDDKGVGGPAEAVHTCEARTQSSTQEMHMQRNAHAMQRARKHATLQVPACLAGLRPEGAHLTAWPRPRPPQPRSPGRR